MRAVWFVVAAFAGVIASACETPEQTVEEFRRERAEYLEQRERDRAAQDEMRAGSEQADLEAETGEVTTE